MIVYRGTTEHRLDVHEALVKKLGGLDKIKDKVANEKLMFGEKYYLEIILDVANKFKEMKLYKDYADERAIID